jgi:HPt (histidine-containing phosphotransfer) domain-containing protein
VKEKSEKIKSINLDYLMQRTKSDPKLMMELIALYLKQTPPLIKTMNESFKNKDWDLLRAAVHKIIPSFSIIGINEEFENAAKKVQEYAGKGHDSIELAGLVLQIETICAKACEELEDAYNSIKKTIS